MKLKKYIEVEKTDLEKNEQANSLATGFFACLRLLCPIFCCAFVCLFRPNNYRVYGRMVQEKASIDV